MMKKIPFFKFTMGKVSPFAFVLIFLASLTGFAQTKIITGKVMSEGGIPAAGVSVHVKVISARLPQTMVLFQLMLPGVRFWNLPELDSQLSRLRLAKTIH
jgi:hypothetical protein